MNIEELRRFLAYLESLKGPTADTLALIERKRAELAELERPV